MKTNKAELYNSSLIDEILNSIEPAEANRIEKRMLLAAKIEDAMKAKGLNKSQFASLMKKKNSVITKWLSGTHNFTSDTLSDIENVLDIKIINTEIHSDRVITNVSIEASNVVDKTLNNYNRVPFSTGYFINVYSRQINDNSYFNNPLA